MSEKARGRDGGRGGERERKIERERRRQENKTRGEGEGIKKPAEKHAAAGQEGFILDSFFPFLYLATAPYMDYNFFLQEMSP